MLTFTRGGRGWNQTRRAGELAVPMAAAPIGALPAPPSEPSADVGDVKRIARLAAAIERARDRRLTIIAANVTEQVRSAPRMIRLRDLGGGAMHDQLENVLAESGEQMLRFFVSSHLPERLQRVSDKFAEAAIFVVQTCPKNAERTVALRKLLEGKDCAVRALSEYHQDKQREVAAARALVGRLVRFAHQADEASYRVTAAVDGMVEIDGLPGRFSPHLFVMLPRTDARASK